MASSGTASIIDGISPLESVVTGSTSRRHQHGPTECPITPEAYVGPIRETASLPGIDNEIVTKSATQAIHVASQTLRPETLARSAKQELQRQRVVLKRLRSWYDWDHTRRKSL